MKIKWKKIKFNNQVKQDEVVPLKHVVQEISQLRHCVGAVVYK